MRAEVTGKENRKHTNDDNNNKTVKAAPTSSSHTRTQADEIALSPFTYFPLFDGLHVTPVTEDIA